MLPFKEPQVEPEDDERQLRLIALKSAMLKKAETRKRQRERPYSPTDAFLNVTVVEAPQLGESGESNMEISPVPSPALEDAVLLPIDMDIATPEEEVSNSPTFYSFEDPSSIPSAQLANPQTTFDNTTNLRKSLSDGLVDEDEEHALRSMLLARMNTQVKKTGAKSMPVSPGPPTPPPGVDKKTVEENSENVNSLNSKDESEMIECNLKKAAKRLKELSENELSLVDANLDKIIGNFEPAAPLATVNLKEVVERLKQKNLPQPEPVKVLKNAAAKPMSSSDSEASRVVVIPKAAADPPKIPKKAIESAKKLKPAVVTSAMATLAAANRFKKLTASQLPAPVIMKRKLKTKSSIINVPFKPAAANIPNKKQPVQVPPSSLPSTSKVSLDHESFLKPVPKLVIQLSQFSSSDSEWDSDSPAAVDSPAPIESQPHSPAPVAAASAAVDVEFERKLDQFLAQARAKVEATEKSTSQQKATVTSPTSNVSPLKFSKFLKQTYY